MILSWKPSQVLSFPLTNIQIGLRGRRKRKEELEREKQIVEGGTMLGLKMMDRKLDQWLVDWASPPPAPHILLSPFSPRRSPRTIPAVSWRPWNCQLKQAWQVPSASLERESEYLPSCLVFPLLRRQQWGQQRGRIFLGFLGWKDLVTQSFRNDKGQRLPARWTSRQGLTE